jgi:hypothetical protein
MDRALIGKQLGRAATATDEEILQRRATLGADAAQAGVLRAQLEQSVADREAESDARHVESKRLAQARNEGFGPEVRSAGGAAHGRRVIGRDPGSHHDDGRPQREEFAAEAQSHWPAPGQSSRRIPDDSPRGATTLQLIAIIDITNEIACAARNGAILVEVGSRTHLMGDARDRTFDPTDALTKQSTLTWLARTEAAMCLCFRSGAGTGAAVACGDLRTMAAGHETSEPSGAAARMRRDPS